MTTVPVCYCGNSKIFGGIFMSVLSIIKHTSAALDIILLTMDLSEKDSRFLPFSEEQRSLMERVVKEKNSESRVRIFDVTSLQHQHFDDAKNQKNNYNQH